MTTPADLATALRGALETLATIGITYGLDAETEDDLARWRGTLERWEDERAVWDRDRADVMLCAVRYAMGRMTMMPRTVQQYVRAHMHEWPQLERNRLAIIIDQEAQEAQRLIDAGVIDAESVTAGSPLGNPIVDRPGWLALRDALRGGGVMVDRLDPEDRIKAITKYAAELDGNRDSYLLRAQWASERGKQDDAQRFAAKAEEYEVLAAKLRREVRSLETS